MTISDSDGRPVDGQTIADRARVADAAWRTERAAKAKLEREAIEGQLVDRDLHDQVVRELGLEVKKLLTSMPRRMAPILLGLEDANHIEAELNRWVKDVLGRLSRERKPERRKGAHGRGRPSTKPRQRKGGA
jgi:hypothetical protein